MTSAALSGHRRHVNWLVPGWPLLLALATLAVPTVARLGEQVWSKESGAHGPIVLVTGLWLLWRKLPEMRETAKPGDGVLIADLDGQWHFRRYRQGRGTNWEASAEHEAYATMESERDGLTVLAVLVGVKARWA